MYRTVLHEWFDQIWNRDNMDAAYRLLEPDAVIHNLAQDGRDSRGPDEFLAFYRAFHEAFPDMHVEVHETGTEGEIVFGRWTVNGTHTGGSLGFPATNRPVSLQGMSLARVRGGRIVESWNIWEAAAMREQLGFRMAPPAVA